VSLMLVKRPRPKGTFVACSNGCPDRRHMATGQGFRAATFDAVILDERVPLCKPCAEEWARAWDGALEREAVVA
jgi:hypothetical protein